MCKSGGSDMRGVSGGWIFVSNQICLGIAVSPAEFSKIQIGTVARLKTSRILSMLF
jgi:hypothetical protein